MYTYCIVHYRYLCLIAYAQELAGRAMKWAAHFCASGRLSNSNEAHRGSPLGESIASKWSDSSKDSDYNGKPFINYSLAHSIWTIFSTFLT